MCSILSKLLRTESNKANIEFQRVLTSCFNDVGKDFMFPDFLKYRTSSLHAESSQRTSGLLSSSRVSNTCDNTVLIM
jgi:hypothetical protein